MDLVRFNPWVGDKYAKGNRFGRKVLLLGESHYADQDETSDFTQRVVREWGQQKRSSYFTVIAKLLTGKSSADWISDEERASVWNEVAFYNYIQEIVGPNARIAPSQSAWADAKEPFRQVLVNLQPDLVVVLGYGLHSRLDLSDIPCRSCRIRHPSGGFAYSVSGPIFRAAIEEGP